MPLAQRKSTFATIDIAQPPFTLKYGADKSSGHPPKIGASRSFGVAAVGASEVEYEWMNETSWPLPS